MRVTRLALAAAVLVAGCGQSVAGSPVANPESEKKAAERLYNESVSAIEAYVTKVYNFRGTLYFYAAVNERKSGSDIDIAMRGPSLNEPYSVLTKSRSKTPPGYDYDIYSPASDPLEYVKLGKAYNSIAPTPWVSMPGIATGYACAITGLQTLCKMIDALNATDQAAPPGRTKTATRLADGSTEVRTAVTLKAFVDRKVINMPPDVVALIEPGMMSKLAPLKIVVNNDGTLQRAEVKGEVQGQKTKVLLEVGYVAKGPSEASDFPAVPQAGELTALPDKAARDDFWNRMATVQN